jgi:hypothetical protein
MKPFEFDATKGHLKSTPAFFKKKKIAEASFIEVGTGQKIRSRQPFLKLVLKNGKIETIKFPKGCEGVVESMLKSLTPLSLQNESLALLKIVPGSFKIAESPDLHGDDDTPSPDDDDEDNDKKAGQP